MKRVFCLIFILSFMFISCSIESDILSYQENNIKATCKINGQYTVNIIKKDDVRTLEIIEPKQLSSISFSKNKDGIYAICDDISIPINEEHLNGICAIIGIFDIDKETLIQTSSVDGIGVFIFEDLEKTYTLCLNGSSLPQSIKIKSDSLDFNIDIISLDFSK